MAANQTVRAHLTEARPQGKELGSRRLRAGRCHPNTDRNDVVLPAERPTNGCTGKPWLVQSLTTTTVVEAIIELRRAAARAAAATFTGDISGRQAAVLREIRASG